MGQVKSTQINFVIEPAFMKIIDDNFPNKSDYIRRLIIEDLVKRGLVTPEVVMEVYVG